jgi:hypothetical protein
MTCKEAEKLGKGGKTGTKSAFSRETQRAFPQALQAKPSDAENRPEEVGATQEDDPRREVVSHGTTRRLAATA